SMDFFTVPTLTGRILFVLVMLSHQRQRIVHVNVTDHPTATWCAQQLVEAFPHDTAPTWWHRDRDAIYADIFQRRLAGMRIADVISGPSCPWVGSGTGAVIRRSPLGRIRGFSVIRKKSI